MAKYINADEIDYKTICYPHLDLATGTIRTEQLDGVYALKADIDAMPAADVQEVKHAKDLMSTEPYGRGSFECSNCHFYDDDTYTIDTEIGRIKYCPNCGAKIDLEDDK